MSESHETPPAAEQPETDAEIAEILKFEPVPRRFKREGGWTPQLQRLFIARLAVHGSPGKACDELGMYRSGIDKVYKSAGAESFRAAWAAAVELADLRRGEQVAAGHASVAGLKMPFVDNRRRPAWAEDGAGGADNGHPDLSEEEKWDLMSNIGVKFMRKVAAEREARLAGEIVAADFYLRQITFLEVTLDLMSCRFGWDPQQVLRELRRGGHGPLEIASTWLSDWMDRSRRLWWAREGEPDRPPHPDVRFLERHRSDDGDYATAAEMYACHGTRPPPGVSKEEWQAMSKERQQAAIDRIRAEDAAAQVEWERQAHADWEARQAAQDPSSSA